MHLIKRAEEAYECVMSGESDHRESDVKETKLDDLSELKAFNTIVSAVQNLDEEARRRVITSALTLLGLNRSILGRSIQEGSVVHQEPSEPDDGSFSEDRTLSAKEFMLDKKPRTDVERIATLAYYLTHYRGVPHFKTLDLSKLNTEAAQIKFSNAAKAVDNATAAGLLVPAGKGKKQISAIGELYVQALPDRDAARAAIAHARRRRKRRTASRPQIRS